MEFIYTIIKFFQDGGPFMVPIAIVLGLGAAIAIERYVYLSMSRTRNRAIWNKLLPSMQAGNFRQALTVAEKSKAAVSRILSYGLNRARSSRRRDEVEVALEEGLMEIIPKLEKRTHYLATFANIATLLGLLGTIIGLIEAFSAVSSASPAEKADLLSASIKIAMHTTAFGLMVGIPLLLIHAWLQTKTTELIDSLEMASVRVVNLIAEHSRPREAAA